MISRDSPRPERPLIARLSTSDRIEPWIFQTVKTSRNSEIHLHFVGGGTPADGGAEALALERFSRGFDWRAVDNHSQNLHGDRIVKGFERSMIYVVELSKSVVAHRMV